MTRNPVEVVQAVLANPTSIENIRELASEDVTYVSLNYDNAELQKILPWTGTSHGPEAIVNVFTSVGKYWENLAFDIKEIFGSGENVAVFGSLTYKSNTLGKITNSPFSIWAKVADGKIVSMQFLEDTFGSASSFRAGGSWRFQSNPDGGEVTVGMEQA